MLSQGKILYSKLLYSRILKKSTVKHKIMSIFLTGVCPIREYKVHTPVRYCMGFALFLGPPGLVENGSRGVFCVITADSDICYLMKTLAHNFYKKNKANNVM